jgi:acyl-coenzyme A synthetase/AMP-(fatty) acid ligase/L-amino acid N-acyltransferase YncA/acyl carrier protein
MEVRPGYRYTYSSHPLEVDQMVQLTSEAAEIHSSTAGPSVVTRFERQADSNPERAAVRRLDGSGKRVVTFDELDCWANAVATDLIAGRSARPEPVALMICTPEMMLAGALGALKAGKFYAAVNPLNPAPYVRSVLDELDTSVVLCDERGAALSGLGGSAVSIEEIVERRPAPERLELELEPERLAYVLYTSGSSGRPKGVAQSRRDMLHNVERHRPLAIGHDDCVTLISADGFVASVSNPYVALLNGATLAPYSFRDSGADAAMGWLRATGVTALYGFPSFLRQIAAAAPGESYEGLRLAYLGGETVLPSDLETARRLFGAAALSVGLNSSETGLTCLHTIPAGAALPARVPVGRPVLDVDVIVVDEAGTPLARGEPGEIEIRSRYVRPRYWRRDGATADETPTLGFRTGDLGHVDAEGLVFHDGRVDQMVKVRGHRVETGEVEAAISALATVAEAAVFVVGEPATGQLAACVVACGEDPSPMAVRSAVARRLPSALIPTRIAIVDRLPRTHNGKLDRRRLAGLVGAAPEPGAHDPPRRSGAGVALTDSDGDEPDAFACRIADIWRSELHVDTIDLDADLFALGGTSLTAVSIVARVRRELNVALPLAALFEMPTMRGLTTAVRELRGEAGRALGEVIVTDVDEHDLAEICGLVNHYIEHTRLNFRTEPQTPEEWQRDWTRTRSRYPWLAARVDGSLVGVAYAGSWKGRAAYDWCAEVSVYVAHDARRAGVGRALYRRLLADVDRQGYRTQVAAITLPNAASVALHEACGFHHAGTLNGVGHKHGEWVDVGFWQRGAPDRTTAASPIAAVPRERAGGLG